MLWIVAMSIRRQMLEAASRAKVSLDARAAFVNDFIISRINEDGGFKDRAGRSDLYYTVFGVEALLASGSPIPRDKIISYLAQFEQGQSLDFVHLVSLVRCWADLSCPVKMDIRDTITRRIENHLMEHTTIYTCFLALCACQDLGVDINDKGIFLDCINSLHMTDGGYANEPGIKISATPVTAAAVAILNYLNEPVPDSATDWLFSCIRNEGGFGVMSQAATADLLSTATALHALSVTGTPLVNIKQQCLDFIDGLWNSSGGFCGSSADRTPDCEYTYYALLSLGHLS